MSHIMVDLETLGVTPGAIILSIGAVYFSPTMGLGREFQRVISRESSEQAGLLAEVETVEWWKRQSPAARRVLELAEGKDAFTLQTALQDLRDFIDLDGVAEARVWGNGASFDNALLTYAYKAIAVPVPWKFWNNRCFRTLKSCAPNVAAPQRIGTLHNALDDAKNQALHAVAIMKDFMRTGRIGRPEATEPEELS